MLRVYLPFIVAISTLVLAGCNGGVAAIVGASSSGGSDSNAPASLSGFAVTDAKTSPAALTFRLLDAESNSASVTLRYQVAGQEPQLMTQLGGAENPQTYASSPDGVEHQLIWDFASESNIPNDGSFTPEVVVWATLQEGQVATPGVNASLTGLGNDAPLVGQIDVPSDETVGIVPVTIALSDSSSDIVNVRVEYSLDGSEDWALARPGALGFTPQFAISGIEAPDVGTSVTFFWDTNHDLPNLEGDARLRFTPVDPAIEGTPEVSPEFRVDNNAEALLTLDNGLVALEAKDTVGGIAIPFKLLDPEGDDVRVVFQWRESNQPFPTLPIDDVDQMFAIQDDPALRAQYQVCSLRHHYLRGDLVPVDATHARLPALGTDRSPLATAEYRGRMLEIVRPKLGWTDLSAHWTSPGVVRPIAAVPIGLGLEAWVLDEVGPESWELVRVELATGLVLESLASGQGAPRALSRAGNGQVIFVGSNLGTDWRVDRVDATSGALLDQVSGPYTESPGLRGLVARSERAAFLTVDDTIQRIEFLDGAPQVQVLRSGLAEPWGLALDPLDTEVLVVAERGADRVVEYDWKRDALFDVIANDPTPEIGASDPLFESPRGVAFEWRGKRLVVVTESATLGRRLMALDRRSAHDLDADGLADQLVHELAELPAGAGDTLATGHEGLRLVPDPESGTLGALGGLEQRREIVLATPGDNLIEVDAPFHPPLTLQSRYRVDRATYVFKTSPEPESYVFTWDSRDIRRSGAHLFRAIPFDSEAGVQGSTDLERAVRSSIGSRNVVLDENPNLDGVAPVMADYDSDGDLDVLVYAGDNSRLHLQTSPGQFAEAADLGGVEFGPSLGAPPLIEDLDGDGLTDIAHWRNDRLVEVFRSTAPGIYDPNAELLEIPFTMGTLTGEPPFGQVDTPEQAFLTSCDIDGDGDLDLLASIFLYLKSSEPAPAEPQAGIIVFHQGPGGQFDSEPIVVGDPAKSIRLRQIVPADIDGDGLRDLVVATDGGRYFDTGINEGSVFVYFQRPDGDFDPEPLQVGAPYGKGFGDLNYSSNPASIAVDDLDGDGDLDVAVAIHQTGAEETGSFLLPFPTEVVMVHWQTAPRVFDPLYTELSGGEVPGFGDFEAIAATDMNGDGRVDLVAQGEGGLHVHLMLESGDFMEPPLTLSYGGPAVVDTFKRSLEPIQLADIDGDGDVDAVIENYSTRQIELRLQLGGGLESFTPDPLLIQVPGVTDGAVSPIARDFDADGDLDVMTTNPGVLGIISNTSNWQVFSQSAPRAFTSDPLLIGGPEEITWPGWLEGSDIDGDGDFDLVGTDSGANDLVIYTQDEGAFDGPPLRLATPPLTAPGPFGFSFNYPSFVLTEDFDLDGDLDIVPLPADDLTLPFYFQDAEGSFQEGLSIAPLDELGNPIVCRPFSARLFDWNGDGVRDLVIATDGTFLGSLVVYEASAPGIFDGEPIGIGEGRLLHLIVDDLDGNGIEDLIATGGLDAGGTVSGFRIFLARAPGELDVIEVPTPVGEPPHLVNRGGIFLVDVDVDGDLDVVYARALSGNANSRLALRYQVAPGRFSEPRELIVGNDLSMSTFELQEVDGDGEIDLLYSFLFFQAETNVYWGND